MYAVAGYDARCVRRWCTKHPGKWRWIPVLQVQHAACLWSCFRHAGVQDALGIGEEVLAYSAHNPIGDHRVFRQSKLGFITIIQRKVQHHHGVLLHKSSRGLYRAACLQTTTPCVKSLPNMLFLDFCGVHTAELSLPRIQLQCLFALCVVKATIIRDRRN